MILSKNLDSKNQLLRRLEKVAVNDQVTLSDYIIARLVELDVSNIFSLTGGGIMHLTDAIYRNEYMQFNAVHNEQFASVAADAYSRTKNSLGVGMGTTGPGLANLFTGVVASYQDSSPVLYIGGQVKSADSTRLTGKTIRQNGTFEFDSLDCFKPITKYSTIIESFSDGIEKIEIALFKIFFGRPGPALIEVPLDVQGQKFSIEALTYKLSTLELKTIAELKATNICDINCEEELSRLIGSSKKPLFILGAGCTKILDQKTLHLLINTKNIHFVTTSLAKELSTINPDLFGGVIGLRGNRSANILSQEADLVIFLGTSIHQQIIGWEPAKFNPSAKKIWFEIDENLIIARSKDITLDLVINSSVEVAIIKLADQDLNQDNNWLAYCSQITGLYEKYIVKSKEKLSCYEVINEFNKFTERFSSVVTDAGLAWYVVPQVLNFSKGCRFISSGSFGAMGMAIPYALGSNLALGEGKMTLAITGDGSLMACLQELASLKQNRVKVVLLVLNNGGYGSIRATNDKFFDGRQIGTDRSSGVFIPSISKIAETFEIDHCLVSNLSDIENCLTKFFDLSEDLLIIEAVTDEDQQVAPMVVSLLNDEGVFETPALSDMSPLIKYETYDDFKISRKI